MLVYTPFAYLYSLNLWRMLQLTAALLNLQASFSLQLSMQVMDFIDRDEGLKN